MCQLCVKFSILSTPSLGITLLAAGFRQEFIGYLSTPSLGITRIHVLKPHSRVYLTNFQLPLSGSHEEFDVKSKRVRLRNLSTPSLGITRGGREGSERGGAPEGFQLPLSGSLVGGRFGAETSLSVFQLPLSGSPLAVPLPVLREAVEPFNSLSRDHRSEVCRSQTMM